MIGVISRDCERRGVEEFFQLFKTPWEFYEPSRSYEIVVATRTEIPDDLKTRVLVVYRSNRAEVDGECGAATATTEGCKWLEWDGVAFPVYGDVTALQSEGRQLIRLKGTAETVGMEIGGGAEYQSVHLGYDLFREIVFLLSQGQPAQNAHIPTLDIHIALLRNIMANLGVSFVEIPPVPAGYDFVACMTHDVDFTGIREHKFDHTMWGFVYRALVGSVVGAIRGRAPWWKCWINWRAVFSLPLVYAGMKDDFWLEFDRYMEIEKGLGSTFFFIPFKNYPGTRNSRPSPKRRAAKYDLSKVKEQVRALVKNGCEVGLHGIDAWQDAAPALLERGRITEITGQSEVGVRMHWLYFDKSSPEALEAAGLGYDSTFGYNDAVGFRAGTSQVFGFLSAKTLLELPLSIQDTALFYPGRMNLSEVQAMDSCKHLIRQAAKFGGVLTVNWHTRSLSPERLWGDFYGRLLGEMQQFRVWFGTAGDVVDWFRARRLLRFETEAFGGDGLRLKMTGPTREGQPSFVVRVYQVKPESSEGSAASSSCDIPWNGDTELTLVRETTQSNLAFS